MMKKSGYRSYLLLMIVSAVVLVVILATTAVVTVKGFRHFTRIIVEENKNFLMSTLELGDEMMRHTGTEDYTAIIDAAMKSKFIRYLAVLDQRGKIIAQSKPVDGLKYLSEFHPAQLRDGGIVRELEKEGLVLVSYREKEDEPALGPKGGQGAYGPIWFLAALDISDFNKLYQETMIQMVCVGIAFLFFGTLIILFFGIISRYELARLSIERLRKITSLLANFVPETAKTIIEREPEKALLDKYIQDATVLFLDIEGFSTFVQKYSQEMINQTIEAYFSIFFDLIQKNGGDINETAGDGIMAIFLAPEPETHAQNAVKTALEIQKRCQEISSAKDSDLFPIVVNTGISSGEVYMGSIKMRGSKRDRWTFTASGSVTILAARLSAYAQHGQILVSEETALRTERHFSLTNLRHVSLKNIENSGEVYQVERS